MKAALATVCCYLLAAGGAAAAHAPHVQQRIEPGRAIGKVALGMSLAQVRKALGAPEAVIEKRQLGFGKAFVEYSWNLTEWRIGFVGGRVVRVGSLVRTEKTKEGIGVGSAGKKVERIYGVRCLFGFWKQGGRFANYWCVVRARGGARTAFVVTQTCAVRHVGYDCPGYVWKYVVTDIWLFAPGEQLPVTLQPEQQLP